MTTYRLLHVEDSADDAELVALALARAPFRIVATRVETEEAYVREIEGTPPDVVLCDYNLPAFSAERALAILGQRRLDIPFIVVSNHIDESAAVVAMQQGASDYLPKRDLNRLGKAIESAIDRCAARRERARAEERVRASEATMRAILDSLDARVAVLDADGRLLAVNRAWADFHAARPDVAFGNAAEGDNYLSVLQRCAAQGDPFAQAGLEELRAVMAREKAFASLEYQAEVGGSTRWYLARATPFAGSAHGAVVSHTDITDRMLAHVALERANKGLQTLSKRILAVQEEERRAISRELHDDLGQSLSALKIGLHRVERETGRPSAVLSECLAVAGGTLERLRQMALELRPPQLDQLGLEDALEWLAERQRKATGLTVECRFRGIESRRPPATLESACYRIAQEGLNNAARHAQAKNVRIQVDADESLLRLAIHDDGVGFDPEVARVRSGRCGHLGLISMEERARLAGGRLKVRSIPGGGTTLTAVFPLRSESGDGVPAAAAAA